MGKYDQGIHDMYVNLHETLVYLEQEDVADVVLGVTLERNHETGFLEMF